jgi:hypothetical protein
MISRRMVMLKLGRRSFDSIYKCHSSDAGHYNIARDLSNPFEFISRAKGEGQYS